MFWHHKFCWGADSVLWTGIPGQQPAQHDRRRQPRRLDGRRQVTGAVDRLVGPVCQRQLLPSQRFRGPNAAIDQGYDVSMGVVWYFGGNA